MIDHLLRILIGGCHIVNGLAHQLRGRRDLLLLDDLAHDEPQTDTALGLLFEQRVG